MKLPLKWGKMISLEAKTGENEQPPLRHLVKICSLLILRYLIENILRIIDSYNNTVTNFQILFFRNQKRKNFNNSVTWNLTKSSESTSKMIYVFLHELFSFPYNWGGQYSHFPTLLTCNFIKLFIGLRYPSVLIVWIYVQAQLYYSGIGS